MSASDGRRDLFPVLVAFALLAGVLLRFWPRSPLWLDEAQSVSFAKLPLTDIPEALRQDGAPPLYYLLLHVWIEVFGDSDGAVRALSALCSLGALGTVSLLAHRVGGRRAGLYAALLIATSPFAIRYGTETRMYALVTLEVGLLMLAVHRCLRSKGRVGAHLAVLVCSAALLYTHYWAIFLLSAVLVVALAVVFLARDRVEPPLRRRVAWIAAMVGGGFVAWAPWLPTFAFQRRHTGTPWTDSSVWGLLPRSARQGASPAWIGIVLLFTVVAVAVRRAASRREGIDSGCTRAMVAVFTITALFAIVAAKSSHSAIVVRYTSVLFPVLMVLVAVGVATTSARLQRAAVAIACLIGVALAAQETGHDRTPAGRFAAVLRREATADDVVVYCPDQLGPALNRLLEGTPLASRQSLFPPGGQPGRVDWIDYSERYANPPSRSFARAMSARAGSGSIWLVWSSTYPPTQAACNRLFESISALGRSATMPVREDFGEGDHGALWRFEAPTT